MEMSPRQEFISEITLKKAHNQGWPTIEKQTFTIEDDAFSFQLGTQHASLSYISGSVSRSPRRLLSIVRTQLIKATLQKAFFLWP